MQTLCSPVCVSLAMASALILWSNQASRSDELEGLFHCHIDWRYFGGGHEKIKSRGRIRCCGNEDVYKLSVLLPFQLLPCPSHGKSDSIDALAWILDHDYLARVL